MGKATGEPAERIPHDRIAARAIVFGPGDRILLVRFSPPHALGGWWATPGGALDGDETHEEGLRRELLEETGISAPVGPCVWTRVHAFDWGEHFIRQIERYYVVRVESDEIAPQVDLVAEDVQEIRWWTLPELEASDELFAPRRLPELIRRLMDDGPPSEPFDAGV
jgi:8-oxo-dGTP pyrophosphatase MutT (NUDIX family)